MTEYQKMSYFNHLSANSQTCGFEAISFIRSMKNLEFTVKKSDVTFHRPVNLQILYPNFWRKLFLMKFMNL